MSSSQPSDLSSPLFLVDIAAWSFGHLLLLFLQPYDDLAKSFSDVLLAPKIFITFTDSFPLLFIGGVVRLLSPFLISFLFLSHPVDAKRKKNVTDQPGTMAPGAGWRSAWPRLRPRTRPLHHRLAADCSPDQVVHRVSTTKTEGECTNSHIHNTYGVCVLPNRPSSPKPLPFIYHILPLAHNYISLHLAWSLITSTLGCCR